MIYGTGKRVIELEEKIDLRWKREELAYYLMQLEVRRNEIATMSAKEYVDMLEQMENGEWADKKTEDIVYGITLLIQTQFGRPAVLLALSNSGMKTTPISPDHPFLRDEKSRQKALDQLDHWGAQMKEFIKSH